MEEHVELLRKILKIISQHGLKLKISMCQFAQQKVELLGHIFTQDGISGEP